jgi:hypothetical protein
MAPGFSRACLAGVLLLLGGSSAQVLQCATLADGCDAGAEHEQALLEAIAKFEPALAYGGRLGTFSSSLNGGALAQISYSCLDSSTTPPLISGSAARYL